MKLKIVKATGTHEWYFISDMHVGSQLFYEKGFDKAIAYIESNPKARVILGGDLIEAIVIDDPRFQMSQLDPKNSTPLKQILFVKDKLEPIKEKIEIILDGNHEWKLLRRFGNIIRDSLIPHLYPSKDATKREEMAKEKYGTYTTKLTMVNKSSGDIMYKLFYTHGYKTFNSSSRDPIRREAVQKARLKDCMYQKFGDTDIMIHGHAHKLITVEPQHELYLTDTDGQIESNYTKGSVHSGYINPDMRWYGCSGSFMSLYGENCEDSGYAERAGYDPTQLGYLKCYVDKGNIVGMEKIEF